MNAYFCVDCELLIGNKHFPAVEYVETIEERNTPSRITIRLPKYKNLKRSDISLGDKIIWRRGYKETGLQTRFIGYVTSISEQSPFEIVGYDKMYFVNRETFTYTKIDGLNFWCIIDMLYSISLIINNKVDSTDLKKVATAEYLKPTKGLILRALQLNKDFTGEEDKLITPIDTIETISLPTVTAKELFDWYCDYSSYDEEILTITKPYKRSNELIPVTLWDIRDDKNNLVERKPKKVKVVFHIHFSERKEDDAGNLQNMDVTQIFGDDDGEIIERVFKDSIGDAIKEMKRIYAEYKAKRLEGSFTTFAKPLIRQGDRLSIRLKDIKYTNVCVNKVIEVFYKGIHQEIVLRELGKE